MGWRPSRRLAGAGLVLPLLSVSVLAGISGNPFNGAVFGVAAALLLVLSFRLPGSVAFGAPWLVALGALLFAFGWLYPHFLEPGSFLRYLYAAPTGLVPCPTLSAVIGLGLMLGGLGSHAWSLTLAVLGTLYGVIGTFRLLVAIDSVLLAGAIALGAVGALPRLMRTVPPAGEVH